jgi:hypothetical protein
MNERRAEGRELRAKSEKQRSSKLSALCSYKKFQIIVDSPGKKVGQVEQLISLAFGRFRFGDLEAPLIKTNGIRML